MLSEKTSNLVRLESQGEAYLVLLQVQMVHHLVHPPNVRPEEVPVRFPAAEHE